ncbi:uncharacterized protein LOC141697525 [Apium graveolens]|uniref:uncharacterized protein LOC141697525 n=1 Tax=Apium graveolens TaxID=4045 RepID=UPI003D79BEF6
MANIVRSKKVSDPLDERVRARIIGADRFYNPVYVSSGSEHSSQHGDIEEDDAPCLSNLLCGYLDEHDVKEDRAWTDDDSDSDSDSDTNTNNDNQVHNEDFETLNKVIFDEGADEYRNVLLGQVTKATEIFWFVKSDVSVLRRNVMAFLRNNGYNAGICKTKWEKSGGLASGSYEFIDVLRSHDPKKRRYFIDLNFAPEFEIARRTSQYERLLQTLPNIFVGKSDNLKQIVRIMSDAVRRSLRSRELHLPPWRKNRFMQCKWFGKYKRTVNLVPASPVESAVKCRSVGFVPFMAATTRTR